MGGSAASWRTPPAPSSLARLAAAAGLRFGSDSDVLVDGAPAAYGAAFVKHCELFAPDLNWRRVSLQAGDLASADPNIAFARRSGMKLTGAHLLWHKSMPAGLAALEKPAIRNAAVAHIQSMAGHFAGEVFSWNVANELLDPQNGDGQGLRRGALWDALGPDFLVTAFHAAREADPTTLLAYNDTHLELATRRDAARRDALLRLLDRLARARAPVDAVGLQTHIRLDGGPFDATLYRRFLAELAGRGLRILITEMDVFDIGVTGGNAERDAAVAAMYRDVLAAALDELAVASVVLWGLSDRYTWLTPQTDASYLRADGQPARPLPLDAAFEPKPAFYAIAGALRNAPHRQPA